MRSAVGSRALSLWVAGMCRSEMIMIDCEFLGKVVPLLLRHQVEVQGLWQTHAKGLLLRWEAGEWRTSFTRRRYCEFIAYFMLYDNVCNKIACSCNPPPLDCVAKYVITTGIQFFLDKGIKSQQSARNVQNGCNIYAHSF